MLIESENSYYRQVQEAAGSTLPGHATTASPPDSSSMRATNCPPTPSVCAALDLYRETARLLRPLLVPHHLPVIEVTLEVIAGSGLTACER